MARAFQVLRGHRNDDQVDREEIDMQTQLYLHGQSMVKPEPNQFEQGFNYYEQEHHSPVEYTNEMGGLDTRLLSCIAQEGSCSSPQWHRGEEGPLTSTRDDAIMDDY